MANLRPPAVAGSFYPSAVDELNSVLEDCFVTHRLGPRGKISPRPDLLAGIVPHAGYVYSGACAAHLYACLSKDIERVILLGVNHRSRGPKAAFGPWNAWQTPLGKVPVDRTLGESLAKRIDWLAYDERPHTGEHSIEVQLPLIQHTLGEFACLPISLAHISLQDCAELGRAIAEVLASSSADGKTVILASSDLNHYLSPQETDRRDGLAIAQALALDPAGLFDVVASHDITMCGVLPTVAMLFAANMLGAKQAELLKHCHSGDVKPMREVVGYASIAIEK